MADTDTATTADSKTATGTTAADTTKTTTTTTVDTTKAADAATGADKTLIGGAGKTDATTTTTATTDTTKTAPSWRDDWREVLANGDAKELERLKRFNDPSMVYKSFRAMEQKMSTGELKAQLPADATPEQLTEYRKANGIPETPEGYLKDLPSNIVIGEQDKALFGDFAKEMHEANASPKEVQAALGWYYKFATKLQAEDAKAAATFRQGAEDTLRTAWGKDYHENLERGGEVLAMAPEEIRSLIQNARLPEYTRPDGTKVPAVALGDHPDVAKWLSSISREINPARTLAPAGVGGAAGTVNDEIAAIEKFIQTNRGEYFKDNAKQARYRDLLAFRDKLKTQGRAA